MKHLYTFNTFLTEAYQRLKDYKNSTTTPETLKQDATQQVQRLLPQANQQFEVEDQSDEQKGIKFQFKIHNDLIHLFKVGRWYGQWEYFLNKKRSNPTEIQDYLEQKWLSPVERFLKQAQHFDYYADMIDNGQQWQRATDQNRRILLLWQELSTTQKKQALKALPAPDQDRAKLFFTL